jgi:hypothetical protein
MIRWWLDVARLALRRWWCRRTGGHGPWSDIDLTLDPYAGFAQGNTRLSATVVCLRCRQAMAGTVIVPTKLLDGPYREHALEQIHRTMTAFLINGSVKKVWGGRIK